MKRAFAEINLKTYHQNFINIQKKLSPKTKILAIIKADAYGLGAVPMAKAASRAGAVYLGVAWLTEAIELRLNNITSPILLLSEPIKDFTIEIVGLNITPTIYTKEFAYQLNSACQKLKKKNKVHVKIDTGMNRIGCSMTTAIELIKYVLTLPNLEIEGLYTHFATADKSNSEYFYFQFNNFQKILNEIKKEKIHIPLIHTANSDATINYPESHFDMVRLGISLFKNTLTFKSYVGFIKKIPAQSQISYGGTYQTAQPTYLATIMVGYADGLPRSLSNKGRVLIKGESYPIVGNITMDMTMINIGENPLSIKKGDEVVLIGKQLTKEITIDEIALTANRVNYEILTGISKRVNRIYH